MNTLSTPWKRIRHRGRTQKESAAISKRYVEKKLKLKV
jgi:hypothetical protein